LSTLNGTVTQATAQVALSLQSRLEALNQRITRYPQDAYQRIVAMTSPNVILGTQAKLLAQRTAVQNFLAKGITGFRDKADRNWRIGTYAEMASTTSVARAFDDAGIHRVQQSASTWSPCRVVSLPVRSAHRGLDAARNAGLFHPNCSHKATAYLPGLSIPQAGFEYSEEAEKARIRQRDLEVQIRSAKRKADVAGDPVTRRRELNRVKGKRQELRDHLAATGRKHNSAREQLRFTDGRLDSIVCSLNLLSRRSLTQSDE
jgi:hypothetical protein